MDLKKVVNDQFSTIVSEGYIEDLVKKQLENTVSEIIRDSLREYSDFGKEMKKTVQEKLNINFKDLDIPKYNTLILDTLNSHINELMNKQGIGDIKSKATELLFNKTDDIKLSELVDKFKGNFQEKADDEGWEEFTCIVEESESCDGYYDLYLDEQGDKDKYNCHYFIRINEAGIWYARSDKRDKYSRAGEWEIGRINQFKEYIYNLYAHGTKIVNDKDDIEAYYDDECDY